MILQEYSNITIDFDYDCPDIEIFGRLLRTNVRDVVRYLTEHAMSPKFRVALRQLLKGLKNVCKLCVTELMLSDELG